MIDLETLSSFQFWDITYSTAKNRKKRKKLWNQLMSPEYVDIVRNLSEAHIVRIKKELHNMVGNEGESKLSDRYIKAEKALAFIQNIRGQAIYNMEMHVAAEKNIRKYGRISDLLDYVEYLKDTIEDLRKLNPEESIDFDFFTTTWSYTYGVETPIDAWIESRNQKTIPL